MTGTDKYEASKLPNAIPLAEKLVRTAIKQGASKAEFLLALDIARHEITEKVDDISLSKFFSADCFRVPTLDDLEYQSQT